MKKLLFSITGLLLILPRLDAQSLLSIKENRKSYEVVVTDGNNQIVTPEEGLWSIATEWINDWPGHWIHSSPEKMQKSGDWTILTGYLELPGGKWILQDAYKEENGIIKCVRRFEWQGKEALKYNPFRSLESKGRQPSSISSRDPLLWESIGSKK